MGAGIAALVNVIGPYNGQVILPKGLLGLEIMADGNWTIPKGDALNRTANSDSVPLRRP